MQPSPTLAEHDIASEAPTRRAAPLFRLSRAGTHVIDLIIIIFCRSGWSPFCGGHGAPALESITFYVAHIPTVVRTLISCGWFAIESWMGGRSILLLLPARLKLYALLLPPVTGLGAPSPREVLCASARRAHLCAAGVAAWAYVSVGGFVAILSQSRSGFSLPQQLAGDEFWKVFFLALKLAGQGLRIGGRCADAQSVRRFLHRLARASSHRRNTQVSAAPAHARELDRTAEIPQRRFAADLRADPAHAIDSSLAHAPVHGDGQETGRLHGRQGLSLARTAAVARRRRVAQARTRRADAAQRRHDRGRRDTTTKPTPCTTTT
ncbi:hypothetical protein QYE76_026097 [Lolium multiflorum]|uniref:Uncharacterized protein n=1 Tax=Lolium multiflorum TaxID=4521 RepID=A0AAD8RFM0_LOLMU|nr:hypothetical protein QYE76_026097 [Lolium multiflorum]